MHAIIIDDENKARQLLQAMLADLCPDVTVDALCSNLASGIKSIRQFKPDVVFLDIEMPGYNGLQLLDFLLEDELTFDIVFVTAYSEYAIHAFKLEAVDYLLKPVDADQLIAAVNRCKKKHQHDFAKYQLLKTRFNRTNTDKLAIHQLEGIKLINHDSILFLEGDGSYTRIICSDGVTYTASKNLKYFESVLSGVFSFFRCHKSYIVNTHHISQLNRGDKPSAHILSHEVSVSIDKLDELIQKLGI
jgi:two-component system LytT family response regulator